MTTIRIIPMLMNFFLSLKFNWINSYGMNKSCLKIQIQDESPFGGEKGNYNGHLARKTMKRKIFITITKVHDNCVLLLSSES